MTERNREWEMLGSVIAQFAHVGARPWELRLMALKGKHVSLRDIARLGAKYERDVRGPRLVGEEADA